MPCPPFEDLSAYADHMLGPRAQEKVRQHVGACAACERRLSDLQILQGQLRALQSPTLGFDLGTRLQGQLRAAPQRWPTPRSIWGSWVPAGLAAAAMVSGVWMGSLLAAGTAANAPSAAIVRVFDPVPPGGLCAFAELCRPPKGTL